MGSGPDAGGSCVPDDCKGQPVLTDAKICADGTALGRTECAPSPDGACDWTFPACPNGECTLKDCEGKPSLTDAKICPDGTSLGRSICAKYPNGVCGWDFPPCP